jgi:hypothetical protein
MNDNEVGMREALQNFNFTAEATGKDWIGREFARKEFEGKVPAVLVFDTVDCRHATPANELQN